MTDADCATAVHPNSHCIAWEAALPDAGASSGRGCSVPCTPGHDETCGPNQTCSRLDDPQHGGNDFTECRPLGVGAPFTDCPPDDITVCGANQSCDWTVDPGTGDDGPECVLQCRIGHNEDCVSVPGTVCRSPGPRGLDCTTQYGRCVLP